jgi:hypothetical protein
VGEKDKKRKAYKERDIIKENRKLHNNNRKKNENEEVKI